MDLTIEETNFIKDKCQTLGVLFVGKSEKNLYGFKRLRAKPNKSSYFYYEAGTCFVCGNPHYKRTANKNAAHVGCRLKGKW